MVKNISCCKMGNKARSRSIKLDFTKISLFTEKNMVFLRSYLANNYLFFFFM